MSLGTPKKRLDAVGAMTNAPPSALGDKVSGVLLLNKSAGVTSSRVMRQAQQLLAAAKAGHGGTLDPAADGLLLVLLGEATAFARYLLGGEKSYAADITFGYTSDSDDGDGVLTPVAAPPPNLAEQLQALLSRFVGDIEQTAPAVSALKHNGKRLYQYARAGVAVPLKTRRVRIKAVTLHGVSDNVARLTVECGGGVYIRSIARDLGELLGCGAYLSALRRLRCGGFDLSEAATVQQLEALPPQQRRARVLSAAAIVAALPQYTLEEAHIRRLGDGVGVPAHDSNGDEEWRVFSPQGRFAGVAATKDGLFRPVYFMHWTRAAE